MQESTESPGGCRSQVKILEGAGAKTKSWKVLKPKQSLIMYWSLDKVLEGVGARLKSWKVLKPRKSPGRYWDQDKA